MREALFTCVVVLNGLAVAWAIVRIAEAVRLYLLARARKEFSLQ